MHTKIEQEFCNHVLYSGCIEIVAITFFCAHAKLLHRQSTAPHRSTLLDLFDFVTTMCDANAFVRVPGFHPAMVLYDWLHVVDLSLTPECSASVFSLHSSGFDFQIDFDFFWWHCYSGTYRNHQLWLWYLAGLQSRREAQISICRILWFVQATQNSILSSIENLFFSPCM